MDADINWARWLFYAIVGLPLLVWIFSTRSNVLRLLLVVFVIVFIQDVFAWRRYLVVVGVGPSIMLAYSSLMALYLRRGTFGPLGAMGAWWALFILAAGTAAVIGSIGSPLVLLELAELQEYYVEGIVFFLVGAMSLTDDEEVTRFFQGLIFLICLPLALFHGFEQVTGWRPAAMVQAGVTGVLHGAVFGNANTLADFWAMTIPIAVTMLIREPLSKARRALLFVAIVGMLVSLLLTGARGGPIFTILLTGLALVLCGVSVGRIVAVGVAGVVLLVAARFAAALLFPEAFGLSIKGYEEEGLETSRLSVWLTFAGIALTHPAGVGLRVEHLLPIARQQGTNLASAHNIYIDMALRTGFMGLFAFLGLTLTTVLRNVRAWLRASADPLRRRGLQYALLAVVGFMAGGIVEPLYHNTSKVNQLFWVLVGVSFAASRRALADSATAPAAAAVVSAWAPQPRPVENG
jgi:hypothetical protein